jgi:hypothetical protein
MAEGVPVFPGLGECGHDPVEFSAKTAESAIEVLEVEGIVEYDIIDAG